jgi:hypothetical protein
LNKDFKSLKVEKNGTGHVCTELSQRFENILRNCFLFQKCVITEREFFFEKKEIKFVNQQKTNEMTAMKF